MSGARGPSAYALRRPFRAVGGGLLVLVLALPVSPVAGSPADSVRVAFQPIQSYAGLFIAEREGYFAAEGIRITWVPVRTTVDAIALLAQEQLDVAAGGVSPGFFNAISRGVKLRIVADKGHVGARGGAPVLMVRSGLAGVVKTVADLRGRRFATGGVGDLGHYMLSRVLATHAVAAQQVSLVFLPLTAYVAALQGGAVDAAFVSPPLDQQAAEMNIAFKLVDLADVIPGEPLAFLFYGPSLLDRRRDLGARLMLAYLRGVHRYNEGPTPRNVAILAEYTKIDPTLIRKSGWIGLHPDGFVDVTKLRRQQDWLYELELITVRNPMSLVVDTAFVEEAVATLIARARR